jgi:hypothetical protein
MKINETLWSDYQYQVLVSFIHHLAYNRALSKTYNLSKIKSEFWTKTIDAHLIRAVLDWCMVFGTDSNEIHWKKVVVDKQYQSDFQSYLRRSLSLTEAQMKEYWVGMTTFRNNYVAHRPVLPAFPTVPFFDKALKIAFMYDEWFRRNVNASFADATLEERYNRLLRTSEDVFKTLVSFGPTLKEEYGGYPPNAE